MISKYYSFKYTYQHCKKDLIDTISEQLTLKSSQFQSVQSKNHYYAC